MVDNTVCFGDIEEEKRLFFDAWVRGSGKGMDSGNFCFL